MKSLAIVFLVVMTSAAGAQDPVPAATPTPAPAKQICQREEELGTILPRKRVCRTRAEWAELAQQKEALKSRSTLGRRSTGNVCMGGGC